MLLGSAVFAFSLFACGGDGGNSSSSEETGKASCIENAFDRNKVIAAILDECSVSANDILEADIEGIDLGSCSRNDVISYSNKTILELTAKCGEMTSISSSSAASLSSSSIEMTPGNFITDLRDGRQYRIVQIGNQTWMRDNLNYSKNETAGYCYGVDIKGENPHRDSSSCDNGYGRNYQWIEVMDGNSEQGLCPDGWRLPSDTELTAIANLSAMENYAVFSTFILAGNYNSNADYPPLGWKERDVSGFYWSNTSNSYMLYVGNNAGIYNTNLGNEASPNDYFSVRCVADGDLSCGNTTYSFDTEFCYNDLVYEKCGGFAYNPTKDTCENGRIRVPPLVYGGQTYKTVKIGGQTWMAENLNYETAGSWCYNNSASYCDTYGRLYDWEAAMESCPDGWHLPSREEWSNLVNFAGGYLTAGEKLKSAIGWDGTDDYGFNALPGGYNYDEAGFNISGNGNWWTATKNDQGNTYYRYIYSDLVYVDEGSNGKNYRYSVRCVKD